MYLKKNSRRYLGPSRLTTKVEQAAIECPTRRRHTVSTTLRRCAPTTLSQIKGLAQGVTPTQLTYLNLPEFSSLFP